MTGSVRGNVIKITGREKEEGRKETRAGVKVDLMREGEEEKDEKYE